MPRGRPRLNRDAVVAPEVQEELVTPRDTVHQARVKVERVEAHVDDHEEPRVRTRRRRATVNEDPYFIPREEIPEGLDYEWKRYSVLGQTDPFYLAQQREQGWEPVPPKRHPHWVPPGYNEPHIIKGGMILMDRPLELTLEARKELRQLSKQQVREAEQRLGLTPKGEYPRDADDRTRARIVKEIGRMVAVEE